MANTRIATYNPAEDAPEPITGPSTEEAPLTLADLMDQHQDRIDQNIHDAANNNDLASLGNGMVQHSLLQQLRDDQKSEAQPVEALPTEQRRLEPILGSALPPENKAPLGVIKVTSEGAPNQTSPRFVGPRLPAENQSKDVQAPALFGTALPSVSKAPSPFGSAVVTEQPSTATPVYTGPGAKYVKPGEAISPGNVAATNKAYDERIQSARNAGDEESADKLALAKMSYDKDHPWGSAENHPGFLGKLGHVLGRIGNIAGDIVAPRTMVNIPGTELNKRAQAAGLQNAIHNDEAAVDRRDAVDAKADKTKYTMKDVTDNRKTLPNGATNPNFGKTVVAGVNESDPTDVKYTGQLAAGAPSASTTPLGAPEIDNSNDGFTNRWQVLHPGQVLPKQYVLPAGANQKDFDRVDKQLEQVEKAEGTKAQQDQTNQMRKDAAAAIQAQREIANREHDEVQGRKMVIGTDPSTNREVMVPVEQAKSMGLKDIYDAPADAVNKALSARHFIPLADNADPGDPGIIQMIDQMDKEGKLGVVANRWNDFLAGKVGAGDPEFERLRVAMGLATTLLMNAHVGSRGGAYMMEHFEDLANAKKMNAETLRAGVDQELKYIKSRAMTPSSSSEVAKPKSLSKTEQAQLDALKKKHGLQ